jgi:hypothetical protein
MDIKSCPISRLACKVDWLGDSPTQFTTGKEPFVPYRGEEMYA